MFESKGLCVANYLIFALAFSQSLARPQYSQDNGMRPEERLLNILSLQLPSNKAESESIIQLKPVYIPVPIKDSQGSPAIYHAHQPSILNYVPKPTVQLVLLPQLEHQYIKEDPLQISTTFKNPQSQLLQLLLSAQSHTQNSTQSALQLLSQLLNELKLNNTLTVKQKLSDESENAEKIEANSMESIATPNERIIIIPDILTSNGKDVQIQHTTNLPNEHKMTETNNLLQSLIEKLNSQKLVQERIGAIYLKDSLLNRK